MTPSSVRDYAEAEDDALLRWSGDGDRHAFDEIVSRHGVFALRVASRLVPDTAAAEDIAQEAFIRAWRHAARFDGKRARFTTWLYRVIVNLSIDHDRRNRTVPLPDEFDVADPSRGADDMMQDSQDRSALSEAIDRLPERQRAAIMLVYDEGLSGVEAARMLGVSAKAIERLLSRARALLRDRLISSHAE